MKKTSHKYLYVLGGLALVLLLLACVWFAENRSYTKTSGLQSYVEQHTGLTLDGIVKKEEGEIRVRGHEQYAIIRLTLRKGGLDDVEEQMESMSRVSLNEWDIPTGTEHELAVALKKESVTRCYDFYRTVKVFFRLGGKTSYGMDVFLSVDEDGNEHIYCFG